MNFKGNTIFFLFPESAPVRGKKYLRGGGGGGGGGGGAGAGGGIIHLVSRIFLFFCFSEALATH